MAWGGAGIEIPAQPFSSLGVYVGGQVYRKLIIANPLFALTNSYSFLN